MMTNHGNRLTQGQFSFLPELTDKQISAQIEYALSKNWALGVEYTDDPHPRNTYWEMYGNPMFDLKDASAILTEVNACRKTFPNHYIRVTAFDATQGVESVQMSYIVNRPKKRTRLRPDAGRRSAGVRFSTPCTVTPPTNQKASVTKRAQTATKP